MAETNLTKMNDLGEIKTIDFVEKFSTNIKELLQLLGVTRMLPLSSDMKIQTYKWEVVEKTDAVAEGEDIPLSKVTRKKAKEFTVEWFKRRRAVTAEAIARHGASRAIDEADLKLMRNIQNGIKKQFVTFLGTNPTRIESTSLQKALAASWGKAATFEEFDGAPLVSLVNPLDVADYLGDTKVLADASNTFGMTLLKNFLGTENVIVLNAIPQGKVYTTAVENLVWAYLNVNSSDLGNLFADYSDETGFIAASRDRQLKNLTFESVFFGANTLFAEIPEGVVEATIQAAAPGVGG
ncbi:TPA: phage capsid protein [Streptococcus suis]|uniref:phage major capsid protein n=1 Tax=Streptococcus suis TaxID=1307 RepID=UPI000943FC12|nr:phage capsid protein [Streptococcus suis]QBX30772.1 major capsid protein [Streptococcus phage Javan570]MCH1695652.1 phage capsid protein [Streptococcus suis]MDS1159954.1 phage capsid protein [Streptococcus suis]RRN54637.1 phage capsid protein [Streptococcus suis]HEL1563227.1 phage capsid protein [Streptococcus suis]